VIAIVVLEFKLKGAYSLHFEELAPARRDRAANDQPRKRAIVLLATLLPHCYTVSFPVPDARCKNRHS
jgi:hypothetical protein